MRHEVFGKHLGRDTNQRKALFRGLIRSLVLEGSIVTTEAKVKSIKGLVDKLFVKAKKGNSSSLNVISKTLPQKEVSGKLIELAKKIKNRNSGFTETLRIGRRQGDGAMMVRMSVVSESQKDSENQKVSKPENQELRNSDASDKPVLRVIPGNSEKKEKKTRKVKK